MLFCSSTRRPTSVEYLRLKLTIKVLHDQCPHGLANMFAGILARLDDITQLDGSKVQFR